MVETAETQSADRKKWLRYLANERAEAAVYNALAARRTGDEREILLGLAVAEERHQQYWLKLLDGEPEKLPRADFRTRSLGFLARHFGSVFVLALAQSAETRSPYADDPHASDEMAADEAIHSEVVRTLAAAGRRRLSGTFRAAIFGANDGLVSNLSLVIAIGATGATPEFVLLSGVAGLISGALSMGTGEYISVQSQRELLEATDETDHSSDSIKELNLNHNELALVYRARGVAEDEAHAQARDAILRARKLGAPKTVTKRHASKASEIVGGAFTAALSSFLFFASGAIIPVLPWLFGMSGLAAVVTSLVIVGVVLLGIGASVGILSGTKVWRKALRQLLIGYLAAAISYGLGTLFGLWLN